MPSLQIVTSNAATERPAHLIRVAVPRLNKLDRIGRYLDQLKTRDYDLEWAEVTDTIALDCAAWNEFMGNLLEDRDWLAGKGGTSSWTLPDSGDHRDFFQLSTDEQEEWKRGAYLHVVAVIAPTGRIVYIDPQGYRYARYVCFAADGLPEGNTRAEVRREELAAEQANKAAALAERIAHPPAVPADHGLRFFWNGIKNQYGRFQKCTYSGGTLLHYPEGTITIYATDYVSFFPEIARCFRVENDSDSASDYITEDKIQVTPNHGLYEMVRAAFVAQESHYERRMAKRMDKINGVKAMASLPSERIQ